MSEIIVYKWGRHSRQNEVATWNGSQYGANRDSQNSKKQAQRCLSRKAFLKAEQGILTRKLFLPFRKGTTPCPTQWCNKHKCHSIKTKDRKQNQKMTRITEKQTNNPYISNMS